MQSELQLLDPNDNSAEQRVKSHRLAKLFILSNFFSILLTILPVLVDFPEIKSPGPEWYSWNDILRLLEPIVAFPFQLLILAESNVFSYQRRFESTAVIALFAIFAALYQQGAGFHSASNMFKHTVAPLKEDPEIAPIYDWMRNTWEHLISHYMYAVGGILISWLNAFVFRDLVISGNFKERKDLYLWAFASLLYALVISAVAVQFISGYAVALVLVCVYGICGLGGYLYYKNERQIGKRIVIQYYFFSYCLALPIIIIAGIVSKWKSRN